MEHRMNRWRAYSLAAAIHNFLTHVKRLSSGDRYVNTTVSSASSATDYRFQEVESVSHALSENLKI